VENCQRELIKNYGWQSFCQHYHHPKVITKTRTKTVTRTPGTTKTATTTLVNTATTTATSISTSFSTETATESSTETTWTTTTTRGRAAADSTPGTIQKRNHRGSIEYSMRRCPSRVIVSACANAVGKTSVIYRARTVTRTVRPQRTKFTLRTATITTTTTVTEQTTTLEVTTTTTTEVSTTTATETAAPSYPCGDVGGPGGRREAVYVWDANGQTPFPGENLDIVQTDNVLSAKACCELCWNVQGGGCALWRLSKFSPNVGYCFTLFTAKDHNVCPNEPLVVELQYSKNIEALQGQEWSAGPGPCTPEILDIANEE
jgi:hypothetical protein